jgi:hypothetical protein
MLGLDGVADDRCAGGDQVAQRLGRQRTDRTGKERALLSGILVGAATVS